jgi:hypothetical protein
MDEYFEKDVRNNRYKQENPKKRFNVKENQEQEFKN